MTLSLFLKQFTLAALFYLPLTADGKDIVVSAPNGNHLIFEINPEETFFEVIEKIDHFLDLSPEEQTMFFVSSTKLSENENDKTWQKEYRLDYCLSSRAVYKAATSDKSLPWRDYNVEVTDEEKDIVYYIIHTMGTKSLFKIYNEKSKLKKEGEKIDHLHPFRFLLAIFTDEDLKVDMANIKGSKLVWSEFKKGLFTSLTEETKRNNVTSDQIKDFSDQLGIKDSLIIDSLKKKDWDDFISILIKNVPREGNPDRYDM